MKTLPRCNIDQFLKATHGLIFTVGFTKKDGTFRKMVCRCGVRKGVKGTGKPDNLVKLPYRRVFDMQKGEFRRINLANATYFKCGETFQVE